MNTTQKAMIKLGADKVHCIFAKRKINQWVVLLKIIRRIDQKNQNKLTKKEFPFFHKNAHQTFHTAEARNRLGYIKLYHSPYSPDFAPSDHYLLPKLKKHLTRKSFSSNEKVQNEVKFTFEKKNDKSTKNKI
jgi:transposase